MAKVSLSQAAKDTGVSLPTLSRWRKSGKISAEKKENGGYIIDTSEYDRIGDLKKQSPNMKRVTKPFTKPTETHLETTNEMKVLQVEVEVLRERIKDKEGTIDDLKVDRDEWKKQAQTLLLQHSKKPSEKAEDSNSDIQAITPPEKISHSPTVQNFGHQWIYYLLFGTALLLLLIFSIAAR